MCILYTCGHILQDSAEDGVSWKQKILPQNDGQCTTANLAGQLMLIKTMSAKKISLKYANKKSSAPSSWVRDKHNALPKAPLSLIRDGGSLADEHAMSIFVPTGFHWRLQAIFGKTSRMKSHEGKQVAKHI